MFDEHELGTRGIGIMQVLITERPGAVPGDIRGQRESKSERHKVSLRPWSKGASGKIAKDNSWAVTTWNSIDKVQSREVNHWGRLALSNHILA